MQQTKHCIATKLLTIVEIWIDRIVWLSIRTIPDEHEISMTSPIKKRGIEINQRSNEVSRYVKPTQISS